MSKPRKINSKSLVDKIEKLTQERMRKHDVVSLEAFRSIKNRKEPECILVIEDDETMRKAMRRIFEEDGLKVITASDGTQLSAVLDDSPIDLVILDVGLPWINGFEIAQLMKEHEQLKFIPLIFVSGRTSDDDIKRGFEVGANDYIKKPFDIAQIRSSVHSLLELSR